MGKKRKSEASRLDEVERSMYSSFCSAANSLSQIYTQSMNHQKVSFQAGERHAMEKIYQWILRQHEETSRVTAADIVAYLQHELDYGGGDDLSMMSPRYPAPHHQQTPQATTMQHLANPSSIQTSSGSSEQAAATGVGHGSRAGGQIDQQAKTSLFSNALSSPIRRTLHSYHLPNGGAECYPDGGTSRTAGNETHNNDAPGSFNHKDTANSNDSSSMDMHSDSTY